MSCNSYKANYFRVFLYAAAYTVAYNMKHIQFRDRDTEVESFTMDSLIKRVMLSAVFIKERKTYVQISFSPHHTGTGKPCKWPCRGGFPHNATLYGGK